MVSKLTNKASSIKARVVFIEQTMQAARFFVAISCRFSYNKLLFSLEIGSLQTEKIGYRHHAMDT
jgi:hypothetical protein